MNDLADQSLREDRCANATAYEPIRFLREIDYG